MKKKLWLIMSSLAISSMVGLALVSCSNPAVVNDKKPIKVLEKIKYEFNNDNRTASVLGFGDESDDNIQSSDQELIIPEIVTNSGVEYTVTSVSNYAFFKKNDLGISNLKLPKTMKVIGVEAFYASQIQKIEIPEDSELTEIKDKAFAKNEISEFILPKKIKRIGKEILAENKNRIDIKTYSAEPSLNFSGISRDYSIDCMGTDLCFEYSINTNDNLYINNIHISDDRKIIEIPEYITKDNVRYQTKYSIEALSSLNEKQLDEIRVPQKLWDSSYDDNEKFVQIKKYRFNDKGYIFTVEGEKATIESWSDESSLNKENVIIPESLKGENKSYDVNRIASQAFKNLEIKKVQIHDKIEYIGDQAFANNDLTSVNIGNSVKEIGKGAFRYNWLASVNIPNSVDRIGDWAFSNNQLTSVNIGNSVKEIGKEAFAVNNKITSLELPDSVKEIGDGAFRENQLASVTIGNSVERIGDGAFSNNELKSVNIPNSVTSIGEEAFKKNYLVSVTISNSVTSIKKGTFENNGLKEFTIPDSVKSIGENAFRENDLTSVNIGNSVKSIGENAFRQNDLTSVNIGNSVKEIGESAFWHNELTSVNIPDSVDRIGDGAFSINKLTSVNIGNSVKEIGKEAFSINQLPSVNIPDSVERIGDGAFEYNQLKSVNIGNSVKEIGKEAFAVNKLTSVIIPDGVERIGLWAFTDNNLDNITINNSNLRNEVKYNLFGLKDSLENPEHNINIKNAEGKNDVFTYSKKAPEIIYSCLEYIRPVEKRSNDVNFYYIFKKTSENSVKILNFGTNAKEKLTSKSCYKLLIRKMQLEIPEKVKFNETEYNVTDIERNSFLGAQITSVTIPDSVTNIGEKAFAYNNLFEVTIPDSVTSIGEEAFRNNYLGSVTISKSVTSIKKGTFRNNSLEEFTIPNNITSIGEEAFAFNKLKYITIPDNVEIIEDFAFYKNYISSVEVGMNVKKIGKAAFFYKSKENDIKKINISFQQETNPINIGVKIFESKLIDSITWPKNVNLKETLEVNIDENNTSFIEKEEGIILVNLSYNKDLLINDLIYSDGAKDEKNIIIPDTIKGVPVVGIGPEFLNDKNVKSIIIGKNVKTISRRAFANNKITNLELPDSVEFIEDGAFYNNSIKSLIIPDSVKKIGNWAFQYNNNLEMLKIGKSVETIGFYAFNMKSLKPENINFPKNNNIKELGYESFYVDYLDNISTNNNVSFSSYKIVNIHEGVIGYEINDGSLKITNFKRKELFNVYEGDVIGLEIPEYINGIAVKEIGEKTFENIDLTSLKIPNTVEIIWSGAFKQNRLTSVTIPNSVKSIGEDAFRENQLTSLNIGNSVERIGDDAFWQNQLTSVNIPNSVKEIGWNAFADNQLTSVNIGNGVEIIGYAAFLNNKLTSVNIPNSVERIEDLAFAKNPTVELKIVNDKIDIGEGAFTWNPERIALLIKIMSENNLSYMLSKIINFNMNYTQII